MSVSISCNEPKLCFTSWLHFPICIESLEFFYSTCLLNNKDLQRDRPCRTAHAVPPTLCRPRYTAHAVLPTLFRWGTSCPMQSRVPGLVGVGATHLSNARSIGAPCPIQGPGGRGGGTIPLPLGPCYGPPPPLLTDKLKTLPSLALRLWAVTRITSSGGEYPTLNWLLPKMHPCAITTALSAPSPTSQCII